MPALLAFFFGSATRAALSTLGIGSTGFILGVKTSDAVAVAAGVGTYWYLTKRG